MKKLMRILLLIIPLIVICTGILFFYQIKNSIYDKTGMVNYREHELIEVQYYMGGGMDGAYLSMTLKHCDDTFIYTYEEVTMLGQSPTIYSSTASNEDWEAIKRICIEKQALILGELEPDPLAMMILDAPSTHITFVLENDMISHSSNNLYPDFAKGIFSEIYNILIKLAPKS